MKTITFGALAAFFAWLSVYSPATDESKQAFAFVSLICMGVAAFSSERKTK